jgi:hypothetical protein
MSVRRLLNRALLAAVLGALVVPAGAAAAGRSVPRGWLGVTLDSVIAARHGGVDREIARMPRAGVESVRVAVYWSHMQPYRRRSAVPRRLRSHFRHAVHRVPTDYHALDTLVRSAARHRLRLAPVVLAAPKWAAAARGRPTLVPGHPADYARFVAALARRYGSHGRFWRAHRRLHRVPIHRWQIWNEVSNLWYWDESWATSYPRLLRAAYDAIKAADPRAKVLMAGLNTGGAGQASGSLLSWTALDRIYDGLDAQGLGRPFDATAAHIYTRTVRQAVRVVRRTRAVMERHGDKRPIDVTELAWPASMGKLRDRRGRPRTFFAETDNRGMARRLRRGIRALARHRRGLRIGGVAWYQWISRYSGTTDAFAYSGLRRAHRRRVEDMPAMAAFRSVAAQLEGRRLSRR